MEDSRNAIYKASVRIITKLQLLSVFFEDETVYKIYVRTQVIQKLFENDPELDINKLDLFHLQYTETVIELLRKIKKSNEKAVNIALDEIGYNEELIQKISDNLRTEENFEQAQLGRAAIISKSLYGLYQNLSGYSADPPFPKEISGFGEQFAKEFFHEIPVPLFYELTEFDLAEVYRNGYGIIEKKLLGWQCKQEFQNVFVCGLKAGELLLEVYKLKGSDDYFIFYPERRLFLDLDFSKIGNIDTATPLSRQEKIIRELSQKNAVLKNSIDNMKTAIPDEVKSLLHEYYDKIMALDFINDNFDIQANILKTMLNTK
jgi:hypothetical protein